MPWVDAGAFFLQEFGDLRAAFTVLAQQETFRAEILDFYFGLVSQSVVAAKHEVKRLLE